MVARDEAVDWAGGLDELVERIAPRFRRSRRAGGPEPICRACCAR